MAATTVNKDHFSPDTIRSLAERAGQRCSRCDCGTSGPHTDPTKSLILGEGAHIEAEAPGGPRHNPKKSKAAFHSIENGIWLCRNCHKLVDRDTNSFPVEKLRQIKIEHEARIHREMGSRGLLAPSKIFSVPFRRNSFFTGREDVLAKLAEQLKTSGKAALGQVAAISGLGGIGKTQTAIEFAYRHREEYRAVFFVIAETEAELSSGFAAIARELALPEADEPDSKKVVLAAKRWLETEDGWLLILDNADKPEILKSFVPITARGHVIVTSRARNFSAIGATAARLRTPPQAEAGLFLLERTKRQEASAAERRAVRDLAKKLGNLPLALEQAGAYIFDREMSFAQYLATYERRGLELLSQGLVERQPVAVTWSINIEEVEKQSPASADLLHAAAFLAPDAIPDELFFEGAVEISCALGEAVEGKDSLAEAALFTPLLDFSLIDRDAEAGTISVHRLVQDVIKTALKDRREEILNRVLKALYVTFPVPSPETWHRCERLQSHLPPLSAGARPSMELAWLLSASGYYSRNRARFHEAATSFRRALTICEECLKPGDPIVAAYLNDLANLYRDQGCFDEAKPLYQRSLEIRTNALGENHSDVAICLNNLANLFRDQKRLDDAEPLFKRSLEIWEKTLNHEHPYVALSLNNLALLYRDLHRLDEAEALFKRSLRIREKVFGLKHPQVGASQHNLAEVYREKDWLSEAETLYKSSLAIREKALGKEHPDVAFSLNGLGTLYRLDKKQLGKAEPLLKRSLGIREKTLGNEHPLVASSLSNLASLYRDRGRDDKAAELERRAEEVMARHRARNPGSYAPKD